MEQPPEKRRPPRGPASCRPVYKVDTKGICFLCLRELHSTANKKRRNEISSQFCKLLMRYLKIDFHENIAKASNFKWKSTNVKKVVIELCEDCSLMADTFRQTYCEIELFQMKLNGYVKTISDIMRIAGRIPSRVKEFHERIGVVNKTSSQQPPAVTPKAARLVKHFRKELIQRSCESHKRTFPRVKLTRVLSKGSQAIIKKPSKSVKHSITTPLSPVQTQLRNFLVAYSLSFATVWMLTTVNGGTYQTAIQPLTRRALRISKDELFLEAEDCFIIPAVIAKKTASTVDISRENVRAGPSHENMQRNSITITDSGKTVLLPHQTFKTDDGFVDESIMEYEDISCDLIDISEDGFFAEANTLINEINMSASTDLPPPQEPLEAIKQEPQESPLEVNDRTCTECRIHLSCRAELEKHRSVIHHWENYVQCPICKQMLAGYHYLKNHRKEMEACAIDEASEALEFNTIAKPLFPVSHTVRGNLFCPMEGCFEVFLKQTSLDLHLKAHGIFSCTVATCKEKFDKAHDLALHESQQHSDGQFSGYKCTRCKFHVGGQYQYIIHFLGEHLSINVFSEQCNICRKGFLSKGANLSNDKEVHFRTHHDIKGKDPKCVIKCGVDNCEAFFLKKLQLTSHKVHVHHMEREKKMSCSICGKQMLNQAVMLKHKLRAHSNLPEHEIEAQVKRKLTPQGYARGKYKCGYCSNQYKSKYSLLIHSKVHDHLKNAVVQKEAEEREMAESQTSGGGMEAVPTPSTSKQTASAMEQDD